MSNYRGIIGSPGDLKKGSFHCNTQLAPASIFYILVKIKSSINRSRTPDHWYSFSFIAIDGKTV